MCGLSTFNVVALNAHNRLNRNNAGLSRTVLPLSSCRRIKTALDDAAGLQIADTLRTNVRAFDQAVRKASNGIGISQLADAALQEIGGLLIRAVALAEEACTGTVDSAARASLHAEYRGIQGEIARIATRTSFNGKGIFTNSGVDDSSDAPVDIPAESSVSVIRIATSGGELTLLGDQHLNGVNLSTRSRAVLALGSIRNALAAVSSNRASIGSGINRLQSAVSVLQTKSQNTLAAESVIRDANVAEEVAHLARFQSGTESQTVLTLLRRQ